MFISYTKPERTGRDRVLGDGDGLFLRIRPNGTRTWLLEYVFEGVRRKYTIGVLDKAGAAGESISSWLDNGRLSLGQARAIARQWKADRPAGRDPIAEWEARLAAEREALEMRRRAEAWHPLLTIGMVATCRSRVDWSNAQGKL